MGTTLQTSRADTGPPPTESSDGFRPAPGGGDTRSGTVLLVEAYAAFWLVLFGLIVWTLRRQSRMNAQLRRLERQLSREQPSGDSPSDDH